MVVREREREREREGGGVNVANPVFIIYLNFIMLLFPLSKSKCGALLFGMSRNT
jgi:hypothetical protein